MLPFVGFMLVELLVFTIFPEIVLFLPKIVLGK